MNSPGLQLSRGKATLGCPLPGGSLSGLVWSGDITVLFSPISLLQVTFKVVIMWLCGRPEARTLGPGLQAGYVPCALWFRNVGLPGDTEGERWRADAAKHELHYVGNWSNWLSHWSKPGVWGWLLLAFSPKPWGRKVCCQGHCRCRQRFWGVEEPHLNDTISK